MENWKVVEEILTKAHICVYTLVVKQNARRSSIRRRKPSQERAKVTVDAMLDAAVKLLKRGGAPSITTNRIAETAGVTRPFVLPSLPTQQAVVGKSISIPGLLSWPTWSTPLVMQLCFAGRAASRWHGQRQNPARRFLRILPPDTPLWGFRSTPHMHKGQDSPYSRLWETLV